MDQNNPYVSGVPQYVMEDFVILGCDDASLRKRLPVFWKGYRAFCCKDLEVQEFLDLLNV